MATRKNAIVFAIALSVCGMALTISTQAKQDDVLNRIVGTWVGQPNQEVQVKLPPGEIMIKAEGGKLSGTWTLYALVSDDDGPAEQQKFELPMIDPKFDGKILSFKADMRVLGRTEVEFRLVGDEAAELRFIGKGVPQGISKYKRVRK